MNTGTKTQTPVDYDTATRIFTKLVSEKKAKGYTEGPDGTPYQNTPKEDRVTGLLPQLLNPIDEQEVKAPAQRSELGPCRRSLMAAVSWSVRLGLKSTASIARAC